jgi:curved DNA-binding protein CbpA
VLGVPRGASGQEIRRAFLDHAKRLHPDRNPSPEAATAFVRVRAAFEQLRERRRVSEARILDLGIDRARMAERVAAFRRAADAATPPASSVPPVAPFVEHAVGTSDPLLLIVVPLVALVRVWR